MRPGRMGQFPGALVYSFFFLFLIPPRTTFSFFSPSFFVIFDLAYLPAYPPDIPPACRSLEGGGGRGSDDCSAVYAGCGRKGEEQLGRTAMRPGRPYWTCLRACRNAVAGNGTARHTTWALRFGPVTSESLPSSARHS